MHCGPRHPERLGQLLSSVPAAMHTKGDDAQDYSGYNVWQQDNRMPDFKNW